MNISKDNHFVSVIIPTINRKSLSEVLEGLNNQTRQPDEILVMEDKFGKGQSVMRNEGIEKAKGNFVAFLDDDNVPNKDWLEIFIKEIEKHNADGVSGNYLEDDPFLNEIRVRRNFPKEVLDNANGYFGIGGNCMYKKSSLEKLKKQNGFIFNPENRISQDIELALRLRFLNFKLVYVVNNVRHLKRLKPNQYIIHNFYRGTGIYSLYALSKEYRRIDFGPGLLWNDYAIKNPGKKWFSVFWKRIFGPFDYQSFSRLDYFVLFWIGEKAKSLGFLFAHLNSKLKTR
jgi:glycosyltransferase involved in cell wall biosynthesis